MANTDIYPYGQNAEMPEGYPIADNLNTNSAQQALSAKQGKKIGDFIATYAEVDTSLINEVTGILLGTNPSDLTWSNVWVSNDSYKGKVVPVQAGKTYRISAVKGNTYYAVLQDNVLISGQTPNYATGTTERTALSSGDSAEITIPVDGNYLYIYTSGSGNDREPAVDMVLNADNSSLAEVVKGVAGSQSLPMAKREIVVAASDAPAWQKVNADFQCDGVNDELTIQAAIDSLEATGGRIRLTAGVFIIDSFPKDRAPNANRIYTDSVSGDSHRYAAIMLPQCSNSYIIEGDTFRTGRDKGTILQVSDACYESLGSNDLRVILAASFPSQGIDQIYNSVSLSLRNVSFRLPWNQKPIMCIDLMFVGRPYLEFIECHAYVSESAPSGGTVVDLTHPCPKAVQHCVGMRSTGGSNQGCVNNYKEIHVSGFYEGFKFSGEHVICMHCGATLCVYGMTFGNFTFTHASMHPMTLINCSNERCVNGPYFAYCSSNQQIDLLQWNEEQGGSYIPGGVRESGATERTPGTFRGRVEYTITRGDDNASPRVPWVNDVAAPFWEDGHGHGFISRNMAHLPACSTSVRNTYKPDYLERIWDTTLNKEVICVDEGNGVWKDAMGNTV